MPYITREDGEHFVIPSYRDVLSAKNSAALKKEILLLSQNYGEYITLQRKGKTNYEIAFSPDSGYLLGETVWQYFERPVDMIYCEAIPGSNEVIMVVVKSGSVYLDGSFAADSIADELVVFLTQENNFDIYIHGDVPISQEPEDGKFAFDAASVNQFTVLDEPVFQTLPLLKAYQLQLVDTALKAKGIGATPIKPFILGGAVLGLAWMMYVMFFAAPPPPPPQGPQVNPYQVFLDTLSSPAPDEETRVFIKTLTTYLTMPGWNMSKVTYSNGLFDATVISDGSKVASLMDWAEKNDATVDIKQQGVFLSSRLSLEKRAKPKSIYKLKEVLAELVDRIATVNPGNTLRLSRFVSQSVFRDVEVTIVVQNASPLVMGLIGEQFRGLPIVLRNIEISRRQGTFTGSFKLNVLGN